MKFHVQPAAEGRLGEMLKHEMSQGWVSFRAAVAFVKRSGTKHIAAELTEFAKSGAVEIIVGIDHQGTSFEGLTDLLKATRSDGSVLIFHNRLPFTFHPKIFLFSADEKARVFVGSCNFTEGGLFTNYEVGIWFDLDLKRERDAAISSEINSTLDLWADRESPTVLELNEVRLAELLEMGLISSESTMIESAPAIPKDDSANDLRRRVTGRIENANVFGAVSVPRAPRVLVKPSIANDSARDVRNRTESIAEARVAGATRGFVMTLQKTDVGVGQVSRGAGRRSPEIFIPLKARDMNPEFWGWPEKFVRDPEWAQATDSQGFGKMDRRNVPVRLGGAQVNVTIWYNPRKRDLRIRGEALRSAGEIGDILRIESINGSSSSAYYVEMVPAGTTLHEFYLTKCIHNLKASSAKLFGYY